MSAKVKLIFNPIANLGRAWTIASALRPIISDLGDADWTGTVYPTHATELARKAADEGYDVVVAMGGDGTMHEVLNGLMQVPADRRPKMGIVPVGSGNDFAHACGISANPETALRQALTGTSRPLDIGVVRDGHGRQEYWANAIGIGFDTIVTLHSRKVPLVHGFAVYLIAVLQTILFDYQPFQLKMKIDDREWERELVMLVLMNGKREGGGFHVTPDSKPDDGHLDFLAVDKVSRLQMLRILPEVMNGTQAKMKNCHLDTFKKFELISKQPLYIHLDGEIYATPNAKVDHLSVEIMPAALQVISLIWISLSERMMPDLLQSLIDQDFGFLQILADIWQVDAPRTDSLPERAALVRRMLEPAAFNRVLAELPENAGRVLAELQQNEGRILWNSFTRKFGEVREFGAGKREREQPHLHPISPSEVLWYRALISKAFLKRSGMPQEFAFIPSDVLEMLPPPAITTIESPSLKVSQRTTDYLASSSGDDILDHCCTLLAALRLGNTDYQSSHLQISPEQVAFLTSVLKSSQIIDDKGVPSPEETREHLESSRSTAWQFLFRGWSTSSSIRDLFSIAEFTVERAEEYSPASSRSVQLSEISGLPVGEWILFEDYLKQIQNTRAEFLRPDGNFDTWLIRSSNTGEYLNGYSHWNDVEGAYIRHLIRGPLFWLGVMELGYSSHASIPACFRVTSAGHLMMLGASPETKEESARILFKPGSQILCPALVPRWVRYLLARMSEWNELTKDGYMYQFTPQSLAAARKQTLHVSHLVSLLRKYGAVPPPPSLIRSFQRWEDHGSEVSLENIQILRVTTPEILQQIMKSRAARYLAEPLGPTAVVIKPGVSQKLSRLLIELGYLSELK